MRRRVFPLSCYVLIALVGARAHADAYDPPANYYAAATGTSATLKQQLNDIIDGHTVRSYDSARMSLQLTDADLNLSEHVVLVYNRESLDVADIGTTIPGWDGSTWNREHTWPESRLDGGSAARSDLFNLRPSRNQINSDRGNLNFGGAYGQSYGVKNDGGATVWYPGNADAGMIARQAFYMDVRYDGIDSGGPDLEVTTGNPADGGTVMGNLTRLVEWNYAAPPDEFERKRNQLIYSPAFTYSQGNRNPFTDHPEWAWSVFVNNANDSQLGLQGAVVDSNGSSSLAFDLGRRLVGSTASQSVTINKTGVNGTYFRMTPTGQATSTITGQFNAFAVGASGSKPATLGLPTSTAGFKTGTVTIDNLDVTTGGGAGHGGNDADDIVSLSSIVLDHANPSFDAPSDQNTLTHGFGTVTQGSTAIFSFDVFNLPATASYTAGLDLDGVAGSGHTSVLTTDLATFGGVSTLAAGEHRSFIAALNTAATGMFAASYTLYFSDENLPGAAALGSLTLQLSGTVQAGSPTGDFNQDGMADGFDFLAWQRGVGATGGAALSIGDGDHNGAVNGDDLTLWQNEFGVALPVAAAVPEPGGVWLAVVGSAAALIARRRHTPA